jgi:hypothetical protein
MAKMSVDGGRIAQQAEPFAEHPLGGGFDQLFQTRANRFHRICFLGQGHH